MAQNNNANALNRILQELIDLRGDVNQSNRRLGNLELVIAPAPVIANEEEAAGILSVIDPAQRGAMLANPNKRGQRILNPNMTDRGKAGLAERYNALLLRLHQLNNGANALPLDTRKLKSKRRKMHTVANDVAEIILATFPDTQHWVQLDSADQLLYSLFLEEKVFLQEHIAIHLCKKQWCARSLLSEALKAVRARRARTARRALEEMVGKKTFV